MNEDRKGVHISVIIYGRKKGFIVTSCHVQELKVILLHEIALGRKDNSKMVYWYIQTLKYNSSCTNTQLEESICMLKSNNKWAKTCSQSH